MSGKLIGLVVEHGPRDLSEFAVAVVIAEDMHNPGDTALLSLDELATRSRLGRSTVARVVKQMIATGWLTYTPGRGRGHASRYRLMLGELSTAPEKVPQRDSFDLDKGSRSETLSAIKGPAAVVKGPAAGLPTVTVKNTTTTSAGEAVVGGGGGVVADASKNPPEVSSSPDFQGALPMAAPSMGGDLVDGGDLAALAVRLRDALEVWPSRSHRAVARFQVWMDTGWTFDQLVDYLDESTTGPNIDNPEGLIVRILDATPDRPPRPKATRALPHWCGECDPLTRYPVDENGYPDSTRPRCDCYFGETPTSLARQQRKAEAIASGARWAG